MDKVVKKDLIVGCFTKYQWNDIRNWALSIDDVGFQGEKVVLVDKSNIHEETVRKLKEKNFKVCYFVSDRVNIVVDRFLFLHKFLSQLDLNQYGWVIFTDVKDVIFQWNPSNWIDSVRTERRGDYGKFPEMIVSSECLKYKDEDWGNQNLKDSFPESYERLKDKVIYNAGTTCAEVNFMKDFSLLIYNLSVNNPRIHNPDQAALNFLVHSELFPTIRKTSMADASACQAGTVADPNKIGKYRPFLLEPEPILGTDGRVYTKEGKLFCLVHQYDRVPEWKKIIDKRYKEKI